VTFKGIILISCTVSKNAVLFPIFCGNVIVSFLRPYSFATVFLEITVCAAETFLNCMVSLHTFKVQADTCIFYFKLEFKQDKIVSLP